MKNLRILVTAVGGNLGRSMVLYLNKFNFELFATDSDPILLCAPKTQKRYLIPRADKNEKEYLQKLNKIIIKNRVNLALFLSDIEIRIIAKNQDKIKTKVWLPSYPLIKRMQDKYSCNKLWREKGVNVPESTVIASKKQLKNNIWLRPLEYIGGGGAHAAYAKTKKDAQIWIEKYRGWGKFTMNEYLPGKVFGFDSLWRNGKLMGYFLKERIEYTANTIVVAKPSTSSAKTSINKQAIKTALKAIKSLVSKPDGVFSVDMKENKKGIPCVTEINPGRFLTTSLLFFKELNYDLPLDYIKLALGEKIKKRKPFIKNRYLFFVNGLTRLSEEKDMKIETL